MRKHIRTTVIILTFLFLMIFFLNLFFGNPFSRHIVRRAAENYLSSAYPDQELCIDQITFDSKVGDYHAYITAPGSTDTHFIIGITTAGEIRFDRYESMVLEKNNTIDRLETEYSNLVDSVLKQLNLQYRLSTIVAEIAFTSENNRPGLMDTEYAISYEDIEIDGIYDIRQLGAQAGILSIVAEDSVLTYEKAAEILLAIKSLMDDAQVPFYSIHFRLIHPRNADGSFSYDAELQFEELLYTELEVDTLLKRISPIL